MAEPRGIRERMGLDFLLEGESKRKALSVKQAARRDEGVGSEEGLITNIAPSIHAFAPMLVLRLVSEQEKAAGSSGVPLEAIGTAAHMSEKILVPLAIQLEDAGLLEVVDASWGNHRVRLGKRGEEILAGNDDVLLLQVLGMT